VIRRELQAGNITTGEYTKLANTLYRSLLKMHIALQILPNAAGEESKTPGDIYGYSDNFIPTITAIPIGSNFAIINPIFTAISTTINGEVGNYPPIDTVTGKRLPLEMKNNPDAKPILMLAEWQQSAAPGAAVIGGVPGALVVGAAGALTAANHFHDGPRNFVNEVEHIQPKNLQGAWPVIPPKGKAMKGAPPPNLNGYTAPDEDTWVQNRDRLGNRLLCKRDVNNHAEDRPLDWKISNVGPGPVCPKNPIPRPPALPNYGNCTGTSKHYRGDGRAIVNKWLGANGLGGWLTPAVTPAIATPPLWWGDVEIEKWEKEIIDLLILILP
jgi:hypothetical protein